MKKYLVMLAVISAITFTGCQTLKDLWDDINKPDDPPPVTEVLDLTKVKWLGANYSAAAKEEIINSASMDNKNMYTDYKPYTWKVISMGPLVDAIPCIFYEKGNDIVGGKFDWWRKGGQGTKTLENLRHGYQGHTWPEEGVKVWTCIVSVDGAKRSNTVEVKRK